MQGAHHVFQKFTTTVLPARSASDTASPSGVRTVKAGAGSSEPTKRPFVVLGSVSWTFSARTTPRTTTSTPTSSAIWRTRPFTAPASRRHLDQFGLVGLIRFAGHRSGFGRGQDRALLGRQQRE